MRAVKVLLVTFLIIIVVTGYIMYNSGISISISFKNPSWNKTGDQGIETSTTGEVGQAGAEDPAYTSGDMGTADQADAAGPGSGTGAEDASEPAGTPGNTDTSGSAGAEDVAGPADTIDTESEAGTALPVVRRVHELFQSRQESDEKSFREILDLLPGIDWSLYSKEYGSAGAVEVLEWLYQSPLTAEGENMLNIFKATKGLDGASADQYGVIVGNFFRNDMEKYVKLLARLDRQSVDRVCRFAANNNYYHVEPEEAVKNITARFEGRDPTDSEKYVVDAMLKAIEAYITCKST